MIVLVTDRALPKAQVHPKKHFFVVILRRQLLSRKGAQLSAFGCDPFVQNKEFHHRQRVIQRYLTG